MVKIQLILQLIRPVRPLGMAGMAQNLTQTIQQQCANAHGGLDAASVDPWWTMSLCPLVHGYIDSCRYTHMCLYIYIYYVYMCCVCMYIYTQYTVDIHIHVQRKDYFQDRPIWGKWLRISEAGNHADGGFRSAVWFSHGYNGYKLPAAYPVQYVFCM